MPYGLCLKCLTKFTKAQKEEGRGKREKSKGAWFFYYCKDGFETRLYIFYMIKKPGEHVNAVMFSSALNSPIN